MMAFWVKRFINHNAFHLFTKEYKSIHNKPDVNLKKSLNIFLLPLYGLSVCSWVHNKYLYNYMGLNEEKAREKQWKVNLPKYAFIEPQQNIDPNICSNETNLNTLPTEIETTFNSYIIPESKIENNMLNIQTEKCMIKNLEDGNDTAAKEINNKQVPNILHETKHQPENCPQIYHQIEPDKLSCKKTDKCSDNIPKVNPDIQRTKKCDEKPQCPSVTAKPKPKVVEEEDLCVKKAPEVNMTCGQFHKSPTYDEPDIYHKLFPVFMLFLATGTLALCTFF